MAGYELRDDADAVSHRDSMRPILRKIFGDHAATSAQYGRRGILVNLLVGRGSIYKKGAGDPGNTSRDRTKFGEITCGHLMHGKAVLSSLIVCWYDTPTFGASLLASINAITSMDEVAAALEEAIPAMRGAEPADALGAGSK